MALERRKFTESEASAALQKLAGWEIKDSMLTRLFEFKSYKEGLTFAVSVGWIADRLDHHPDLEIGYQKVRVSTVTHDADGLTAFDFELASRIEKLLND